MNTILTVGRSSRTPFKHWLLNAELGRLAGIFANQGAARKVGAVDRTKVQRIRLGHDVAEA